MTANQDPLLILIVLFKSRTNPLNTKKLPWHFWHPKQLLILFILRNDPYIEVGVQLKSRDFEVISLGKQALSIPQLGLALYQA